MNFRCPRVDRWEEPTREKPKLTFLDSAVWKLVAKAGCLTPMSVNSRFFSMI